MILAPITELLMHPVADRGLPNLERIPILVQEQTEMSQFGLLIGSATNPNFAVPIQDNFFWFGEGVVNPGDWILLYTGSGTPRTDDWNSLPGAKVYSIHWGRNRTVFANTNIVPLLFKTTCIQVGASPSDLPQIGAINQ